MKMNKFCLHVSYVVFHVYLYLPLWKKIVQRKHGPEANLPMFSLIIEQRDSVQVQKRFLIIVKQENMAAI